MTTCDPAAVAAMSTDFWKLLRSYEALAAALPPERTARAEAQTRYASDRLTRHLETMGMKLVSFDGMAVGTDLPIVVVNAEELSEYDALEVETTLEPAIIAEGVVVQMARVIAKGAEHVSGN